MEIIEKAQKMLEKYPLCDNCLGRQFALLGYGMDNQKRGESIKIILTMSGHQLALAGDKRGASLLKNLSTNSSFPIAAKILKRMKKRVKEAQKCYLCEDCFKNLHTLAEKVARMLQEYEYDTFLVGVKLPVLIEEREDEFKAEYSVQHSESIRNEFSRVLGKMLIDFTGKSVDLMKPQVAILINPFMEEVEFHVNSVYIMGRYRKLMRGIPQSRWICAECWGKGCSRCGWTGKMYPESVEELVARPVLQKTFGEDFSFHAAGREDIDALMLGRGRPFIIEVKKPRRRYIDLLELEEVINKEAEKKIEVSDLKFVDRDMVRKLKRSEKAIKVYRVVVNFDREISDEEIKTLEETFTGATVLQRTPFRVLQHRADRVREKYIYETKVKRLTQNSVEMRIRCQGGLYIKELITGDEGRTDPHVSKILNVKATPIKLDVLNILMKEGES